jgi:hypothetical protein
MYSLSCEGASVLVGEALVVEYGLQGFTELGATANAGWGALPQSAA